MAKQKTVFVCQNCGAIFPSWMGKCSECNSWNTIVEEIKAESQTSTRRLKGTNKPLSISEISSERSDRILSGLDELDIVLGGGIVKGSLVLVGGDPGIGKSTLLLQVAADLSQNEDVLYISAEESLSQIKLRADRINGGKSKVRVFAENDIDAVISEVNESKPQYLIIDSIQTMQDSEIPSSQGSVSQVREITAKLMKLAKSENIVVFIIGHVTKSGQIAGPKVLEHMVDTVLYFEGEKNSQYRLIRAVKNRFGSTNELGIFEMKESGLEPVQNPSELFIAKRPQGEPGSAVFCSLEGSRPLLTEIQALTQFTSFPSPRRIAIGLDYNRLNLLLAVMEKKLGIVMGQFDVYINVVGGIEISETASDLALAGAILSAYRNKPIREGIAIFGEVGLAGEIRTVSHVEKRVNEAEKLGFKDIIMPKQGANIHKSKIKVHEISKLTELIDLII